jgi:hypothetical protein
MNTEEDIAIEVRPEISEETQKKLSALTVEEGQVIVHCKIVASLFSTVARIWPSTWLIDKFSDNRSKLVHLSGITKYPVWTEIPEGRTLYFTLVFSPLPKSCQVFDLLEEIPESGGFHVANIIRNVTDVYSVDLSEDAG